MRARSTKRISRNSLLSAERIPFSNFPTLLAFRKCGNDGWILSERSGRGNARVPEATMDQIGEALTDVLNVFVGNGGAGMLSWVCGR